MGPDTGRLGNCQPLWWKWLYLRMRGIPHHRSWVAKKKNRESKKIIDVKEV